ncbi:unnamed protein product [Polarella glacialis]|uniref:Calpain catalytic domain-containing protein n=1 Tax=Polarella glacialis TaxID=89957 RepID=A0A813KSV9_POLGL|nr:unnamed protein product [Polarella glacialis]
MPGKVAMAKAEQKVAATFDGCVDELIERVRHYMVEPPVVNATAGQKVCFEMCMDEVDAIIARCRADGTRFTDLDWNMEDGSPEVFYVDRERPGWDCTVGKPAGYKRLTDIVKDSGKTTNKGLSSLFGGFSGGSSGSKPPLTKPMVFKGGVQPGDIIQGNIGTCFLLGALGALASKGAGSVEQLFIRYEVDVGVYGVRVNINGEWSYVIVDDLMPVDEAGQLMYGRCKDPQEVWVPVLEKAYCKMMTCYEMCDGGQASEAIAGFMGGVGGRFQVRKVHRREPSRYFTLLTEAKDKGWLVMTSFMPRRGGSGNVESSAGKCGEAVLPTGLVAGHAYAVIQLVEVHGNQLVCCMNPWGSGEWTGRWSDHNTTGEWTEEMIEATNWSDVDDGKFWMSIEDFVANTAGVDYARTFGMNWKKVTQYSHFPLKGELLATATKSYEAQDDSEISFSKGDHILVNSFSPPQWWSGSVKGTKGLFPEGSARLHDRPVACFDLLCSEGADSKEVTAVVMLMQRNTHMQRRWHKRKEDGLNYKDTEYSTIQLTIIDPKGRNAFTAEGSKRCIWGELSLTGRGIWRIYALASDGKRIPFTLRVYLKDGTASLREVHSADIQELAAAL